MAENSWVNRLGPGHGEAVVLDINPVLNRAMQQNQQNLAQARAKAKAEAAARKQQEDELYKLTNQGVGTAGYREPHVNQMYQDFTNDLRNKIARGEQVDLNKARLEYNSFQRAATEGKTGYDAVQALIPKYEKEFVDIPQFDKAYRANLDELWKKHLASGGSKFDFKYNPEQVAQIALEDPRYKTRNAQSFGTAFLRAFPKQTYEEKPVVGRPSQKIDAASIFKIGPNGLPIRGQIDMDVVKKAFDNPVFKSVYNNNFEANIRNPDSPLFDKDFDLKIKFGEGTPAYRQARENLKQDYFADFLVEAGVTPEGFEYSGQWNEPKYAPKGPALKKGDVPFARGEQQFITIGGSDGKKQSHKAPVEFLQASIGEVQLPLAAGYDQNLMSGKKLGSSNSAVATNNTPGLTALPYLKGSLTAGNKKILDGTPINLSTLKELKGPYTVTRNGKSETFNTIADLMQSDFAVDYAPTYVVQTGVKLNPNDPIDQAIAQSMGTPLSTTNTIVPLGERFYKASGLPIFTQSILRSPGAPKKQDLDALFEQKRKEAKEAMKQQVGAKSGPSGAAFFKPVQPTQKPKASKPLDFE